MLVKVLNFIFLVGISFSLISCSPKPSVIKEPSYMEAAHEAIKQERWEAAYRLLEDYLVSDNEPERMEAFTLIEKHPEIKSAAFKTFSKKSMAETYRVHDDQAWRIEQDRLEKYLLSIATKEQYQKALNNFHHTFDQMIARDATMHEAWLDSLKSKSLLGKEINEGLSEASLIQEGDITQLLKLLKINDTSLKEAVGLLGRPSGKFEMDNILTWPLRVQNDQYVILSHFIRSASGVTHSLVLVFNTSFILTDLSLVKVIK